MEVTKEARILYTPRSDATPEAELGAVSRVLKFILFESKASKKSTRPGAPDDVREDKNAHTTTENYT
jgi:hypothetical protein